MPCLMALAPVLPPPSPRPLIPAPHSPRYHVGNDCLPTSPGFINFRTGGGEVFANCRPFMFKGLNWYGTEGSEGGLLDGLDRFPITHFFHFMALHKINALRLPFAHKSVQRNAPIPQLLVGNLRRTNPEFVDAAGRGIGYVESLIKIVQAAASENLLVVLAAHALPPDNGLWYSTDTPEFAAKASWSKLADVLCDQWNVIGVDLHNEPHKATWGQGSPLNRWDMAASRLGNHVLSKCPRWLILVEGIAVGAVGDGGTSSGYWRGENLVGALQFPIALSDPTKLVYAPHTFGPSKNPQQPYFAPGTDFPANMPDIWRAHFLEIKETGAAIVLGSFGGKGNTRDDVAWQHKAMRFFPEQRVGFFFYCLNPTSEDARHSDGLLLSDWKTVDDSKADWLRNFPSTDVAYLLSIQGSPSMPPPSLSPAHPPSPCPPRLQASPPPSPPRGPPQWHTFTVVHRPSPSPPPQPPQRPLPSQLNLFTRPLEQETEEPPPDSDPPPLPPPPAPDVVTQLALVGALTFVSILALVGVAFAGLSYAQRSRRIKAADTAEKGSARTASSSTRGAGRKTTIDVEVSTRRGGDAVTTEIQLDRNLALSRSVRGAMQAALTPWLGDRLLAAGFQMYLVDSENGSRRPVIKSTPFTDVIGASLVQIVLEANARLPAPKTRAGRVDEDADDGEEEMLTLTDNTRRTDRHHGQLLADAVQDQDPIVTELTSYELDQMAKSKGEETFLAAD